MDIEPHSFSDNEAKVEASLNALSGNSAEANGIKVSGNTVNLNLPKNESAKGQSVLLRFAEGIKKLRDPVAYERERREATLIALRTEEEILESYRRMFPGMGEERLFLLAHGYVMTDAQSENVFATMKASSEMVEKPPMELPSPAFTDAFVEGSAKAYDDEVRELFARILAGELERPGMFSRRAMGILSRMDKEQVESFRHLCSFALSLETTSTTYKVLAMSLDGDNTTYNDGRLKWYDVSELGTLGLVEIGGTRSLSIQPGTGIQIRIENKWVGLSHNSGLEKKFSFDPAFTKAGEELSYLCDQQDCEGIVYALRTNANKNGFTVTELAMPLQ